MTVAHPMPYPVARRPRYRRIAPLPRWATTGALIVSSALILVFIDRTRVWEAVASAWVLDTFTGVPAVPVAGEPEIFLDVDLPWILVISPECAGGFIAAPFLAIGAVLASSGRFAPGRMLAGVALGVVVVAVINQARVVSICWALVKHGAEGYGWMHTVGGSLMSLFGIALALLVLWRVSLTPRRGRRARRPEATS